MQTQTIPFTKPVSSNSSNSKKLWGVISASSVGTLIEYYDFYIFGSLATIVSAQFFPQENPTAAFLSTLATFAAGFIVRPFGALVFGRLGDMIGRKHTFLLTLILMGGSTFLIGVIPGYASIGYTAPFLVLLLRLIQGLALGGEYGGAATYVAEHSPHEKRGFYTSFIQTTASMGLLLSIGVILLTRYVTGTENFAAEWGGWRIPFILSSLLVGISILIRLKMEESPEFANVKATGTLSSNPLKESFGKKENLKLVLLALFGVTAGQGVIWYTGQFYALTFIQKTMQVDFVQSNFIIAISLLLITPFFIFFGAWSDKIGRKGIMITGVILGIFLFRPIYKHMYSLTDLTQKTELPASNSTKTELTILPGIEKRLVTITRIKSYTDGTTYQEVSKQVLTANQRAGMAASQVTKQINLPTISFWLLTGLVCLQILFVTMVYGPVAAFLVEMFPVNIRYTSMSLPYHIGYGVFGGLTPFIAISLTSLPGASPFDGLWYPIGVATLSVIIGMVYIKNTTKTKEQL